MFGFIFGYAIYFVFYFNKFDNYIFIWDVKRNIDQDMAKSGTYVPLLEINFFPHCY